MEFFAGANSDHLHFAIIFTDRTAKSVILALRFGNEEFLYLTLQELRTNSTPWSSVIQRHLLVRA